MIYTFAEQELIGLLEANKSLSTFDLRLQGLCTPNTVVHSLRNKGVKIKTTLRETIGHKGKLHKNVAHYSLEGESHE